jgi:vacuolar-type H+-ATPase subunit F/Vma7
MPAPVVIADELTALGFRLAGARVYAPQEHAVQRLFAEVCSEAEVILMTAEKAACIPAAQLSAALLASRPLLVVIPDARNMAAVDDLTRELRRALGVEE